MTIDGGPGQPMVRSIRAIYAGALRFARAVPPAFLLPVVVEFAQHVIEVRAGMYGSRDAFRAAAADADRLAWGFAKVLALLPAGYWFVRYLAFDDPRRAWWPERPAIGLFAIQLVLMAMLQYLALFGPSLRDLFRLSGTAAAVAAAAIGVVEAVLSVYLLAWFVAWPLGNRAIGPLRSFLVMHGAFWRTVGYLLAGMLPLMAVHYALGLGAIGRPAWLAWPMLMLDAVSVGFLALTLPGAGYMAVRDAAGRRGVALLP